MRSSGSTEEKTMRTERMWEAEPLDIELVRQWASEREEFRVRRNAGGRLESYDYTYLTSETFAGTMGRREMRGLQIESATQAIAARPLHKFFNWGERPEEDAACDWSAPHYVCEKRDGTLMFPAELSDGTVIWCTRAGRTDMAAELEAMIPAEARARAEALVRGADGTALTPCFEHTCPENRIVVGYSQARLTLLAVRERVSGRYLTRAELVEIAAALGRDADDPVQITGGIRGDAETIEDPLETVRAVRARTGEEGVVIAFESGHRIKVKTEEYIALHHIRSDLESERRMLECALDANEDSLCQILPPEATGAVRAWCGEVRARTMGTAREVADAVQRLSTAHGERKAFAQAWTGAESNGMRRAAGFQARGAWERRRNAEEAAHETLVGIMRRKLGSSSKVTNEVRPAIGIERWTSPMAKLEVG